MNLLLATLLLTPTAGWQEPAPPAPVVEAAQDELHERTAELLRTPVLRQDDRTWTAREVVDRLGRTDKSLWGSLASNPDYTELYLASPLFYDHVRWFSNLLLLDAADIPSVNQEAMLAEGRAWAADRGHDQERGASLAAAKPFEIEARARLLAQQPVDFEENRVRARFHQSVPEFFGRLKLSWIALPLFSMETGKALGEAERLARYNLLDEVAQKLGTEELDWETAVQTYDEDPRNDDKDGLIGWVKRTDTKRYEYELLRHVFADLGFTAPQGSLLRGPIFGDRWVYLARIEGVRTQGVVEFQRVRARVERAMREDMAYARIRTLAEGVERSVLLPPTE